MATDSRAFFKVTMASMRVLGFDCTLSLEDETIYGTRDVIVCMVLRYERGRWLAVFRDVGKQTEERQKFRSYEKIPDWIQEQWNRWENKQRVMRYYSFDYEQFLSDYKINKAALKTTKAQIKKERQRLIDAAKSDGVDIYNVELEPSDLLVSLMSKEAELKSYMDLYDTVFDALEERDRIILQDFYAEKKSVEEIADKLGIVASTVVHNKGLALQKVKQIMQPF